MRASSWWLAGLLAGLTACAAHSEKPLLAKQVDLKAASELAEASYGKGDWVGAAQQYAILVQHIPQDANLWFRLGNAYARSDQPDQAVAAYRETLVRDGAYSKAWFNMGIVQLRQAANSFLRMQSNVSQADPMRPQAEQAYASILKILGDGGATAASPAGDVAAVVTPAADGAGPPVLQDAAARSAPLSPASESEPATPAEGTTDDPHKDAQP